MIKQRFFTLARINKDNVCEWIIIRDNNNQRSALCFTSWEKAEDFRLTIQDTDWLVAKMEYQSFINWLRFSIMGTKNTGSVGCVLIDPDPMGVALEIMKILIRETT